MASYIIKLGACLLSLQQCSHGLRLRDLAMNSQGNSMTKKETSRLAGRFMMMDNHQPIFQTTPPCEDNKAYQELASLLHNDWCMSTKELWPLLRTIRDPDYAHHCRRDLQKLFSDLYGIGSTKPSKCVCKSGPIPQKVQSGLKLRYEALPAKCKSNSHFNSIANAVKNCTTHHAVWFDLFTTPHDNVCQLTLIEFMSESVIEQECQCLDQAVVVGHTDGVSSAMSPTVPTPVTSTVPKLPAQCDADIDVRAMLFLKNTRNMCHSVDVVFKKLQQVQSNLPECMVIVDIMADHYGTPNTTKCSCSSSGLMPAFNPFKEPAHIHTYAQCSGDPYYKGLMKFLFEEHPCIDHKLIWSTLQQMSSHCRTDFINMATRYTVIGCACGPTALTHAPIIVIESATTTTTTSTPSTTQTTQTTTTTITTTAKSTYQTTLKPYVPQNTPHVLGPTTTAPTTTAPTTTAPKTTARPTTTTATSTTTHVISKNYLCNKFKIIQAFTSPRILASFNVTNCHVGSWDDSFVQTECNVSRVNEWRRGPQLRPFCDQIPQFTPVAVFQPSSTTYNPTGARSGIFGGCLANGFKLIVEHCEDREPAFVHILDGGLFLENPLNYYVIN